jgi:mRNA-degrading endonuclease RelE of RelBE toxin-antitoxin system
MQHHATAEFWKEYRALPQEIRNRANEKFSLLKSNQQHPSIQFKKLGERKGHEIWSARVSLNYRALAIKRTSGYLWFWIGDQCTYDSLVS